MFILLVKSEFDPLRPIDDAIHKFFFITHVNCDCLPKTLKGIDNRGVIFEPL